MGDEEDDGRPKPIKAKIEDEFLKHPHSGASIRNPLLDKSRSAPILFQAPEFHHNGLEDALQDYQCITVSEAGFKEMMRTGNFLHATRELQSSGGDPSSISAGTPPSSPLARAALSTLNKLPAGYEFMVTLRKSQYVPRASRRRENAKPSAGVVVDKLNIEVLDDGGPGVRIEDVKEGLVATWNRTNPAFQVRPGDRILKANLVSCTRSSGDKIIEEMEAAVDQLRISIRRDGRSLERKSSKTSVLSGMGAAVIAAGSSAPAPQS